MTPIKQWLTVHSISAQTLSGVWAFLSILWVSDPQFHDYIKGAFDVLPKGVHAFMVGVIIPICILWRSQRKTVAIAEASKGESGTAEASATVEPKP